MAELKNDTVWDKLFSTVQNATATVAAGYTGTFFNEQQNKIALRNARNQANIDRSILNSTQPPDSVAAANQNGGDWISRLFSNPAASVGGTSPAQDGAFSRIPPIVLVFALIVSAILLLRFARR